MTTHIDFIMDCNAVMRVFDCRCCYDDIYVWLHAPVIYIFEIIAVILSDGTLTVNMQQR